MIKRWYILVIMVLSFIGIVLSGVLTLAKYNDTIAEICGEDVDNSCNVVQNSEYAYLIDVKDESGATFFQVPVSLMGVLFYFVLFILSVILYFNFMKIEPQKIYWLMFFVGFCGIVASVIFTWIQAYKIEAFCKFCLVSAFESVVLFVFIVMIAFDEEIEKFRGRRKKRRSVNRKNAN